MGVLLDGIERPVALLAELVYLYSYGTGVMGAHDGLEGSPLIPAGMQFVVGNVVDIVVVFPCKESAQVGIPIGDATERIVEAGGNLLAHHVPAGDHVTAPGVRSITLLSQERGTGEQEDTLVGCGGTLVLIHALVAH